MSHDGGSLWFEVALYATTGAVFLIPLAALVELVAAAFSKRVRQYIRSHPVAHVFWLVCALLLVLLLIPAPSHPAQTRKGGVGILTPNESLQLIPGDRPRLFLRGQSSICELHHAQMTKTNVPIAYGLIRLSAWGKALEAARTNTFPHAADEILGGCVVGDSTNAIVYVCPVCLAARSRWELEHPRP
jgi:hypothetical protein